jgi:predicted nucleic acid-binding protein
VVSFERKGVSQRMKPSLYLETTIPSYLAARTSSSIIIAGRQAVTHEFWEDERRKYNLYVSSFVYDECRRGDTVVAQKRLELLTNISVLDETPDIEPLADVYMRILSIPPSKRVDALHLAMCCVHKINYLLSWNCSHLGTESMQIAQKHNDMHGLFTPKMVTPDALVLKYKEVDFNE